MIRWNSTLRFDCSQIPYFSIKSICQGFINWWSFKHQNTINNYSTWRAFLLFLIIKLSLQRGRALLGSGGSKFSEMEGGGANFQGVGKNLLFGQIFPESYMKMKEFGSRGRASLSPPLDPPLVSNIRTASVSVWRICSRYTRVWTAVRYSHVALKSIF